MRCHAVDCATLSQTHLVTQSDTQSLTACHIALWFAFGGCGQRLKQLEHDGI